MPKYIPSIISNEPKCYLCGRMNCELDHHHLLEGRWRKLSDEDGLWVWMCRRCHSQIHDDPTQEKIKELQQLGQNTYIRAVQKKGFPEEVAREMWFDRYGKFFER